MRHELPKTIASALIKWLIQWKNKPTHWQHLGSSVVSPSQYVWICTTFLRGWLFMMFEVNLYQPSLNSVNIHLWFPVPVKWKLFAVGSLKDGGFKFVSTQLVFLQAGQTSADQQEIHLCVFDCHGGRLQTGTFLEREHKTQMCLKSLKGT